MSELTEKNSIECKSVERQNQILIKKCSHELRNDIQWNVDRGRYSGTYKSQNKTYFVLFSSELFYNKDL